MREIGTGKPSTRVDPCAYTTLRLLAEAALDARDGEDRVRRRAVVVALQRLHQLGSGADDGDAPDALAERQEAAVVLQQDDRLACGLQRELAVLGASCTR